MDAKKIGKRLRQLRGTTPGREVCQALGISRSTLSMYEQGRRIPRDEIKSKLAKYYNKSVQEIFFD
ncbi:MAG: helix-turn-helix transcriptional regulator [Tissierellia bacterium]|nr:helix-turn-helix transcriptional regulator [Tissierellia bacterium]